MHRTVLLMPFREAMKVECSGEVKKVPNHPSSRWTWRQLIPPTENKLGSRDPDEQQASYCKRKIRGREQQPVLSLHGCRRTCLELVALRGLRPPRRVVSCHNMHRSGVYRPTHQRGNARAVSLTRSELDGVRNGSCCWLLDVVEIRHGRRSAEFRSVAGVV